MTIINLRSTCSLKPWRKNSLTTLPCGNTIFSSKLRVLYALSDLLIGIFLTVNEDT